MTTATATLHAAAELPTEIRSIIIEFALGNANFHRHKARFAYVMQELYNRLNYKRAYEPHVLNIYADLAKHQIKGMLNSIDYQMRYYLHEEEIITPGWRFNFAIPTKTLVVQFHLRWSVRDLGHRPTLIEIFTMNGKQVVASNLYPMTMQERIARRRFRFMLTELFLKQEGRLTTQATRWLISRQQISPDDLDDQGHADEQ